MEVDATQLPVLDLIKYAKSVGINTHGMTRQGIEDEVELVNQPVVPAQENLRLKTLEDILNALSPAVQQLQAEMKQVQTALGLREEEKDGS